MIIDNIDKVFLIVGAIKFVGKVVFIILKPRVVVS